MAAPAPITSLSKLCRMCLVALSGGHYLSEPLDDEAANSPSIEEAAQKVLGCKLAPDEEYPSTICCTCKRNLLNAFYFQMIVVRSQEVLGEVFEDIKDVQEKYSQKLPFISPREKKSRLENLLLMGGQGCVEGPALPGCQLLDSEDKVEEAMDLRSVEAREGSAGAKGAATEDAGDVTCINEGVQEQSYWCHLCELVLVGELSLDQHIAEHVRARNREMMAETQKTDAKPTSVKTRDNFVCNICDKKFEMKHKYRRHLKSHGVQYLEKCDQCDKAFVHKTNLDHHKRHAHRKNVTTCYVSNNKSNV